MIIGILGYGKMGKEIEKLAITRKHSIGFKINSKNNDTLVQLNPKKINVAIEFSTPSTAFDNIKFCLKNGIPVVSGTTGWQNQLTDIKQLCKKYNGTIFYTENFSIGVHIFIKTIRFLTQLTEKKNYDISIKETHHKTKKDIPSGTALMITKELKKIIKHSDIPIESERIGTVKGKHDILYTSNHDIIKITHQAYNRECFAKGAILAAEFIKNKKGYFSMEDLIEKL